MRKFWYFDKIVIVTGASSGFGKLICEHLVNNCGCKVYGIARRESNLQLLKEQLGENFDYFAMDVSIEQNWIDLAKKLNENNIFPDVLINNAGILPKFKKFENIDGETFTSVLNTNFYASVFSVKHLLPILKKSSSPAIINVASSASLATVIGTSAYSASKSALKSFTECVMLENKEVYVAIVCPGFAKTEIFRSQNSGIEGNSLFNLVCSDPKKSVKKMLKKIARKKPRIIIGFDAHLMNLGYKLFPVTTNRLIAWVLKRAKLELFDEVFN